jgi:hypothetical protein
MQQQSPTDIIKTTCADCGDKRERDVMEWDAECNYPGPFCKKCSSPNLRWVAPPRSS